MSRGSKPTSSSRSGCSGGDFDWEPALRKLDELNARVEDPTLWDKPDEAQAVMRERTRLSSQIDTVKALERELEDALGYAELADEEGDEASLEEARVQLRALKERAGRAELEALLSGEADSNDAYVEVNAGAGGTESQDWAQMLTRMYLRWAERAGFKAEVVDLLPGEEAGIKSATIEITGEYAYGYLKSEIGVHRLIRISPFDASKRRHTSFASVAVIPEVEDVEVVVKDEELRIDVYRSSPAASWSPARTSARSSGIGTRPCASSSRGSTRSTRRSSGRSWPSSPGRRRRSPSAVRSAPTPSIPTKSSKTIVRGWRWATWTR